MDKNTLQLIEQLFKPERIPLSGGGVLEMGIGDNQFATSLLRLQNMLIGSRGLNRLQTRAPNDVKWLQRTMGYDAQFAQQMVQTEYELFQQEVVMNALLIGLLNQNFTAIAGENGVQVGFKTSVVNPPLTVPDHYWDLTEINAQRAAEGIIALPHKAKENPAEQKLGLIFALEAHDRAATDPTKGYVLMEEAPLYNEVGEVIGKTAFGQALTIIKPARVHGINAIEVVWGEGVAFIAADHLIRNALDRAMTRMIQMLSKAGAFGKGGQTEPKAVKSFPATSQPAPVHKPNSRRNKRKSGQK